MIKFFTWIVFGDIICLLSFSNSHLGFLSFAISSSPFRAASIFPPFPYPHYVLHHLFILLFWLPSSIHHILNSFLFHFSDQRSSRHLKEGSSIHTFPCSSSGHLQQPFHPLQVLLHVLPPLSPHSPSC